MIILKQVNQLSEIILFGKVTKSGTVTIPKKLRMKYHIKVGDIVRYADVEDGIKIIPSELTNIPPNIKEIWDEADEKKISIKDIVETVRKVRSGVYNEEYGT
jgi:AbrB family looped-hinge helix DNA binding protein